MVLALTEDVRFLTQILGLIPEIKMYFYFYHTLMTIIIRNSLNLHGEISGLILNYMTQVDCGGLSNFRQK